MKKLALAVLGLAGFAGSALAADMAARPVYTKAPPPAPVYSWTGCYVAGGGGYGMYDRRQNTVNTAGVAVSSTDVDSAGRGWLGTVQGGCDYQFSSFLPFGGSMLVGAFADADWSGIKGNLEPANLAFIGEEKLDRSWAVGGRIGVLPSERLLTYVSAGFTDAHFKGISYIPSAAPGGAIAATTPSFNKGGWFLGSGYEYGLGILPGLFWKTEYRFSSYGSHADPITLTGAAAPAFLMNSKDYVQTVRSELVWRFNWH